MALTSGTRLGPYEVTALLGAGGMSEVYKARETRLDRIVAIKVLPSTLALDPEFRERLNREARAISALDHPNICALYDVGEEAGSSYLVMRFLEGETLADRLAHGALAMDDALRAATKATAIGTLAVVIQLLLGVGAAVQARSTSVLRQCGHVALLAAPNAGRMSSNRF